MVLARFTDDVATALYPFHEIVEIGAGDGTWARALRGLGHVVHAFDWSPRGAGVEQGDHLAAAEHNGALLIVWPPDGTDVDEWIKLKPWPAIIVVGHLPRFHMSNAALSHYRPSTDIILPAGAKGASRLRVFIREGF